MDELINIDSTFNPATFITKVNNIYVMLCISMMTNNLKRVDHFIGDELYNEKKQELNSLNNRGLIQMFDELNVKNTFIKDVRILDDRYEIDVELVSRYMDYRIDAKTREYKEGNNKSRIEKDNILTFVKRKDVKELKTVRTCPTCGSPMDVNNTGICKYCGNVFNQEDYDWVLTKIYTR